MHRIKSRNPGVPLALNSYRIHLSNLKYYCYLSNYPATVEGRSHAYVRG